jgi:hypothetical protein
MPYLIGQRRVSCQQALKTRSWTRKLPVELLAIQDAVLASQGNTPLVASSD